MTFTVNNVTRCTGQNHYTLNVTVSGGPTVDIAATKQDMETDFASAEEATAAAIARMRSAVKEANAATFAQVRTALEGKTFKL